MSDADEVPTITDAEDAAWAAEQRALVEKYLRLQGCDHAGVSLEPRWYLWPYLALWAVRSKRDSDLVGWWAISGDVPTDYMTAGRELRDIADVLGAFGAQWSSAAEAMSRGEYAGIGTPENMAELAPLLVTRASILQELSEQIRAESRGGKPAFGVSTLANKTSKKAAQIAKKTDHKRAAAPSPKSRKARKRKPKS